MQGVFQHILSHFTTTIKAVVQSHTGKTEPINPQQLLLERHSIETRPNQLKQHDGHLDLHAGEPHHVKPSTRWRFEAKIKNNFSQPECERRAYLHLQSKEAFQLEE